MNNSKDDPKSVARVMLKTLISTTLRIFTPVTVLFLIGLAFDLNVATKPFGMLAGTLLGIAIAIALIISQLKSFQKAPAVVPIETPAVAPVEKSATIAKLETLAKTEKSAALAKVAIKTTSAKSETAPIKTNSQEPK